MADFGRRALIVERFDQMSTQDGACLSSAGKTCVTDFPFTGAIPGNIRETLISSVTPAVYHRAPPLEEPSPRQAPTPSCPIDTAGCRLDAPDWMRPGLCPVLPLPAVPCPLVPMPMRTMPASVESESRKLEVSWREQAARRRLRLCFEILRAVPSLSCPRYKATNSRAM